MNAAPTQLIHDLRDTVVDASPMMMRLVLRCGLVLVWAYWGDAWSITVCNPDYAIAVYTFVSGYLIGKLIWSAILVILRLRRRVVGAAPAALGAYPGSGAR